jgi:hypothetical protein
MIIFSSSEKGKIMRRELFYFSASLLAIFIAMEIIFPKIILVYFNINYLLLLLTASGLLLIIKDGE